MPARKGSRKSKSKSKSNGKNMNKEENDINMENQEQNNDNNGNDSDVAVVNHENNENGNNNENGDNQQEQDDNNNDENDENEDNGNENDGDNENENEDNDNEDNDNDGNEENDDNESMASTQTQRAKNNKRGRKPGRHSKARDNRYRVYIFKVLQQVHPKVGITKTAMDIVNAFIEDMFEKICSEAMKLCHYHKTSTIGAREISTAATLVLPGELGKHAKIEGQKAVETFETRLKDLKDRRSERRGNEKGVFPGKRKKKN